MRVTNVSPEERFSEQFAVRLRPSEARALDDMVREGCFASRAQLTRLLVLAILEDDAKAHRRSAE